MKNFNISIFIISTIIFGALLIPSFLAAFGEDEGTLPANLFWTIFAKLFYVLRFPTHTLLWTLIGKSGATIFFGGLLVNCLFYGLLSERLYSLFKPKTN